MLAAACGKGDGGAPAEAGGSAPAPDTVPPPPAAGVEPVALPDRFPADLPIPPGATVVRAEVSPDAAGTAASASLVTTADADDTLSWYAGALADAGWDVERASGAIHAVLGESWADVTVLAAGPGRTEIEARVWKAGR